MVMATGLPIAALLTQSLAPSDPPPLGKLTSFPPVFLQEAAALRLKKAGLGTWLDIPVPLDSLRRLDASDTLNGTSGESELIVPRGGVKGCQKLIPFSRS